jgi:two-component system sensor histidine kinase and response regulator WspE
MRSLNPLKRFSSEAMRGEIFNDASMLEIFRSEVDTHVESLTAGLLALERDPGDTSHLDEMMRGAHSIKGAARIIGVDAAVRVAHVMEDGFVAAQNGKLTLRPDHVDVLLRGVDMLNRIANASNDPAIDWGQFDGESTSLVAEITDVLTGSPAPSIAAASSRSANPTEQVMTNRPKDVPTETAASAEPPGEVTIPIPAMLDADAAEAARRAFVAGLDTKATLIRIDLSKTNDLDATGLALLAAIPAQFGQGQSRIEIVGVTQNIRVVLEATGIDRLYPTGGR